MTIKNKMMMPKTGSMQGFQYIFSGAFLGCQIISVLKYRQGQIEPIGLRNGGQVHVGKQNKRRVSNAGFFSFLRELFTFREGPSKIYT